MAMNYKELAETAVRLQLHGDEYRPFVDALKNTHIFFVNQCIHAVPADLQTMQGQARATRLLLDVLENPRGYLDALAQKASNNVRKPVP